MGKKEIEEIERIRKEIEEIVDDFISNEYIGWNSGQRLVKSINEVFEESAEGGT